MRRTLVVLLREDSEARGDSVRGKTTQGADGGMFSVFMREFKTRFTFWYNEHYQTVWNTFWAERFRSGPGVSRDRARHWRAVAAYIDLNAVRAGLADTPQNYPFSADWARRLADNNRGASRIRMVWFADGTVRGQEDRIPAPVTGNTFAFVDRLVASASCGSAKSLQGSPVPWSRRNA